MSQALLQLDEVVKRFPVRDTLGRRAGAVHAVDGVSLAVEEGETLAIVGESGCGKSTLGRLMLNLISPDSGTVRFGGEDLARLSAGALRARRRHMQLIFQDPFASLDPRMTVEQAVAEPLRLHGIVPRSQERARVADLLSRVGLRPELARRWPHEFSGGQRQRIAIARALASQPKLIVGDEPVSALDVSVQAQVVNLLSDLIRDLGLTFVLISHDLGVVRHVADRVAVMYLGRIVEQGPAEDVLTDPRHPYTRALLAAVPGHGTKAPPIEGDVPSPISPPPGCRFHTRCPFVEDRCRVTVPLLSAAPHAVACHLDGRLPPPAPRPGRLAGGERLRRLQSFFRAPSPQPGVPQ
ncbi:ATP-binding cassette domain-containing protein [Roseomonas terrae]|jgi:oligopeptide transport system ATP-binding protein|uniref:ATP-binding cassette domain-containing protein n=1 Tax=Neoroseomonas terrae TaxID=424799 RepID=A0ABS5EKG1_9PROT|nr:oligopeptide/dipeptide ABC transporter ATP-binding protein [Neoroseomonas terrae]MBR0651502.1 ATP-binding cassette domain-containing protein [Neoroseomonas terrae]